MRCDSGFRQSILLFHLILEVELFHFERRDVLVVNGVINPGAHVEAQMMIRENHHNVGMPY
jgi:hypothetical protein